MDDQAYSDLLEGPNDQSAYDSSSPANTGTLTASTGKNDTGSGSIWSTLTNLGQTAGSIYGSVSGKKKPAATKLPTWVMPVAIGGALLLVVLVVLGRR